MPRSKNFMTINVHSEDHQSLQELSQQLKIPMTELATGIVRWFYKQEKITQLIILDVLKAEDIGAKDIAETILNKLIKEKMVINKETEEHNGHIEIY